VPTNLTVIAIDGPAGSGKSTVGRALAAELGLDYLDTGAMYRGITFAALRHNLDPVDAEVVARLARQVELDLSNGRVVVDGVDATIEIRGPEVTRAVSVVAANTDVRAELRRRQQEWAESRGGGVIEGRDIGSVVFPDAALKVYLTASPQVRAERRSKEVTDLDYETVAADIARRDAADQGRDDSPLAVADGAVLVDTTERDIDEIVADLISRLPPTSRGPGGEASSGSHDATATAEPLDGAAHDAPHMGSAPDESVAADSAAGKGPVGAAYDAPHSGPAPDESVAADTPVGTGYDAPHTGPAPDEIVAADAEVDITGERRPPSQAGALAAMPDEKPRSSDARPGTRPELALYAVIRAVFVGACRLWFRVSAEGTEHVPAEGAFILSPVHRSNVDFALVLVTSRRRMRFLAKDSLWKGQGFWARVFTALGGIPVARGTADREALRTCIEVVEAGEPLVIFPEGARQQGPEVQHCFDGPAFVQGRTGVPIIPVGIGGSETAMPKGSKIPKPHRVRLVVGPALPAPKAEGLKARRAALKARTSELHDVLQDLFDQAQSKAGTPNRPAGSTSTPTSTSTATSTVASLKRVEPTSPLGRFARAYAALAVTGPARSVSRHVSWKLDPVLLRLTGGRLASTLVFPTAVLETRGAKSGERRRNAVIYFHDGNRVVVVASNAGSAHHPAWYHNLCAHPDVTFGDRPMRASTVDDEAERERLWALADRVFPAFATYRRDGAKVDRTIPIVALVERRPGERD